MYVKLTKHLAHLKIEHPGKLATVLLDAFILNNNEIALFMLTKAGLCRPGEYRQYIKHLELHNLICYTDKDKKEGSWTTFKPGGQLVEYINAELLSRAKVVTEDKLIEVISRMIEKFDPPVTKDKIDYYMYHKTDDQE